MKTVIMSIGIPGSGKTTFMKKVAERLQLQVFGPDKIRYELYGDESNHQDDKAVWVELRARVTAVLKSDENVLVDSTFHLAHR